MRRLFERPWRTASLAAGVALLAGAAAAPLDGTFGLHMVQHLLLGDLAPLLVVLGLAGMRLRPVHPLAALPLWAVVLVLWHLTPLYDAALRHDALHLLQHLSFFVAGTLLWAALLEPSPGPAWFTSAWKLVYVLAMWVTSLSLSQVFLWSGHAYYRGYSLDDQRTGGGVMLVEGSFVMLAVIVWLLLRVFRESEERQQRLDRYAHGAGVPQTRG